MQTTEALNAFVTRAEKQMIGIAQDDLGIQFISQHARRQALDGALRADRHEDRGFNGTVCGVEEPGACAGGRTSGLDFKAECGGQELLSTGQDWISQYAAAAQ